MVTGLFIPNRDVEPIADIELNGLAEFQRAVDGWIEAFDLPAIGVTMYVNEGAFRDDRPLNLRATLLWWSHYPGHRQRSLVVGDVVLGGLIGDPEASGDVPVEIRCKLTSDAPYDVQIRQIGSAVWHGT